MKSIAIINFKGGVGKTTVTWCLANVSAQVFKKPTLLFDLDAQMSLTDAVRVKADSGARTPFGEWYDKSYGLKRTIFHALDEYARPGRKAHFDFPIKLDFIYPGFGNNLHFIPSTEDLYWLELDVFDRNTTKDFVRALLGKIQKASVTPNYEYVFFDCLPNFTVLSYSTLATCEMILIPINPDYYAARGLNLILQHLQDRIEPYPLPKVAVFMNKAFFRRGVGLSAETKRYMAAAKGICRDWSEKGARVTWLDTFVPDRVDIKRAVHFGGFAGSYQADFSKLFQEIEKL